MPQFMTLVELAREYGLSIFDVQECARDLGLPWSRGVTMLHESQVQQLRPSLENARRTKQWRRNNPADSNGVVHADEVHVECACCQLRLNCRADLGEAYCDACRGHFEMPGESVDRKMARLSDHDVRMRKAFVRARDEYLECRRKLAAALESRDNWREATTKLAHDHIAGPRGLCSKCNKTFPCETVRIIRSVNYGLSSYTERLAGFSDEEVELYTNPRRAAERDYWKAYDRDDTEGGEDQTTG